jgi:GntR family transcriptional regulator
LRVVITNTSGKPIYEQIKEQVRAAILSDQLHEGDLLPSIRQLARELKISVITTTRAYTDLEQEGFVTNVQGKGCFVSPRNSELVREQLLRKIEDSLSDAIGTAKIAKLSREELLRILDVLLEGSDYEQRP